jgi:hypothetical protein
MTMDPDAFHACEIKPSIERTYTELPWSPLLAVQCEQEAQRSNIHRLGRVASGFLYGELTNASDALEHQPFIDPNYLRWLIAHGLILANPDEPLKAISILQLAPSVRTHLHELSAATAK